MNKLIKDIFLIIILILVRFKLFESLIKYLFLIKFKGKL